MPKTQQSKRKRSTRPTSPRRPAWSLDVVPLSEAVATPEPTACSLCGGALVSGSLAAEAKAAPEETTRAAFRYWLARGLPGWSVARWCRDCDAVEVSWPFAVPVA